MHVSRQFFRFCVVGTAGFVVDAGSLYLIMAATGAGPYLARFFSFILAASATWVLNRTYTFQVARREPILVEWMRYLGYASVGGAINYGVYALSLLGFEAARTHPVIGVAAGSVAGLAFNFLATRYLVFRVARRKDSWPGQGRRSVAGATDAVRGERRMSMQDEGSAPRRTENPPHAVGVVLPGGRAGAAGPRLRLVLLLVFVAGWALAAIKPPLAEVHWDAPIMLYASKRVVDTDFHANFVRDAAEVARQVEQADWDRSVSYFPEPFWVFTKLGHLSLLAGFVALGDTPEAGLRIAHLGFGALLAASVAMAMLLARNLALLRGWSGSPWSLAAGLAVAGLSCVLSGIFWYMSGNFVSEVPALFFVCAALLALSAALRRGSRALAALSGVLLFAAYWCRPDFAWVAICVALLVLLVAIRRPRPRSVTLMPILVGAGFAILGFAVYAWIYHPLADPRLYAAFAGLLRSYAPNPPEHFFRLFVISGGLLWIGVLLALFMRPWSRGVGFGLAWLGLTGLPWLVQAMLGSAAQSRMFLMAWPPLFLLAALGWAALFERARHVRRPAGAATLVTLAGSLALVSLPASYAVLEDMPGGWRLQHLRRWLVPDLVERRSYPLGTLRAMRDEIHAGGEPALVIVDARWRARGNLDILRFLGPPHGPAGVDLTLVPWPHARWENPDSPAREGEPVVFRSAIAAIERRDWAQGRLRLFALSDDADPDWSRALAADARIGRVVTGDGLALMELVPDPRP